MFEFSCWHETAGQIPRAARFIQPAHLGLKHVVAFCKKCAPAVCRNAPQLGYRAPHPLVRRVALRQRTADVREHRIHRGSHITDAGNADQRNQGRQQSIFNQILTFLAVLQPLDSLVQLQKGSAHLLPPLIDDLPGRAGRAGSASELLRLSESPTCQDGRKLRVLPRETQAPYGLNTR